MRSSRGWRPAWRASVLACAAALLLALVGASCLPSYPASATADGGGDGAAAGDAGSDAGLGGDVVADRTTGGDSGLAGDATGDSNTLAETGAPVEAGPPPAVPTTLLPSSVVPAETGNAQQQHLLYVAGSGRWWLFYVDTDQVTIKTQWSLDFVHWTAGASLTPLPYTLGGDARNLSVAYRSINGVDVVHVATSLHQDPHRIVYDTRATISGATITFGAPVLVHDIDDTNVPDAGPQGDSSCDPDGNGVAIAGDGRVYVVTSWVSVIGSSACDADFAVSTDRDQGTSWNAGFMPHLGYFSVPGTAHAHQVIGLASGAALGAWEAADNFPDAPTSVVWAASAGAVWNDGDDSDIFPPVFPPTGDVPGGEELNDWSLCRIDDAHIHAVRRRYAVTDAGVNGASSVLEHYIYSGGGWLLGAAVPADPGVPGTGVVLLTNGTDVMAATIAGGGVGDVRYAIYDGTSWSGWTTLTTTAVTRTFLSGSGCGDPAHPALMWMEADGPPYTVVGAPVLALFP